MSFPLAKQFEAAEALFPLSSKRIPYKPQGIEPRATVKRQFVLA
jgi:hypothetical protein